MLISSKCSLVGTNQLLEDEVEGIESSVNVDQ